MSSQSPSTNNNSRLLAIGAAVLVVGVILVIVILNQGDDPQAEPSTQVTPTEQAAGGDTPEIVDTLTPEGLAVARLSQPLEVPEGHEAVAVRVNFIRGVASVPTAGDHIKVYSLANNVESRSQIVFQDVEVLGIIGPLPQTNQGELTFVLAAQPSEVGTFMELSNEYEAPEDALDPVAERHENELWFTLLPSQDEDEESSQ